MYVKISHAILTDKSSQLPLLFKYIHLNGLNSVHVLLIIIINLVVFKCLESYSNNNKQLLTEGTANVKTSQMKILSNLTFDLLITQHLHFSMCFTIAIRRGQQKK